MSSHSKPLKMLNSAGQFFYEQTAMEFTMYMNVLY